MVPPADDRLSSLMTTAGRRRTTRVLLIDPHRRALLVEGRNPDDGQLTWMTVGSGMRTERIRPKLPRGKCSK